MREKMGKLPFLLITSLLFFMATSIAFRIFTNTPPPSPLLVGDRGLFLGFDSVYLAPSAMRVDRLLKNGEIDSCMLAHRSEIELVAVGAELLDVRIVATKYAPSLADYSCFPGDVIHLNHEQFLTARDNLRRAINDTPLNK